jgi:hypothetical protein
MESNIKPPVTLQIGLPSKNQISLPNISSPCEGLSKWAMLAQQTLLDFRFRASLAFASQESLANLANVGKKFV